MDPETEEFEVEEDVESDIVIVQPLTERTVNPYATFGPAERPGMSWGEWFREVKQARPDPDPGGQVELITPGHEVPDYSHFPQGLKTAIKRFLMNGWVCKYGESSTVQHGALYKTGEQAGTYRSDHIFDLRWVEARLGGHRASVTYYIRDGEPYAAWTSRILDGESVADAYLKEQTTRISEEQ